jgi:hypothetical protein
MRQILITAVVASGLAVAGCGPSEEPKQHAPVTVKGNAEKRDLPTSSPGFPSKRQPGDTIKLSDKKVVKEGFTPDVQLRSLALVGELRGDPSSLNNRIIECKNNPSSAGCDTLMPLVESVVVQHATPRPRHHISAVLSRIDRVLSSEDVEGKDAVISDLDVGGPRAIADAKNECALDPTQGKGVKTPCAKKLSTLRSGGPFTYPLPDDASDLAKQVSALYVTNVTLSDPGNLYQQVRKCHDKAQEPQCAALLDLSRAAVKQLHSTAPLHDLGLMLSHMTYLVTTDDELYPTVAVEEGDGA